jgi:hypothetical protein
MSSSNLYRLRKGNRGCTRIYFMMTHGYFLHAAAHSNLCATEFAENCTFLLKGQSLQVSCLFSIGYRYQISCGRGCN